MLRIATVSDLREVASWIATARDCELWAGWRVSFPIDMASLPEAIGFSATNTFALTDDDRLVALGQLVRKDAARGHLARLIVNPLLRGKGHGEALVRALLEKARDESFERVSLNVDSSNHPAVTLYLKLSFRYTPRPPDEPDSHGSRYMEYTA
jgi:ribosomal protein S18 acetylase RimI-like enzyme